LSTYFDRFSFQKSNQILKFKNMIDGNKNFRELDDVRLLALVVYGEARGEPLAGKIAVASVVLNRLKKNGWFGKTLKDVILKPFQFSCFNEDDPNRIKLLAIAQNWDMFYQKEKALRECYDIARKFLDPNDITVLKDNTCGATHYKTKNCKAAWADKMQLTAVIGNHEFYAEKT